MKKLGFLFPGQGSQKVGMAQDFYEKYSQVKEYFDKASQKLGYDLAEIVFNGPAEKLQETSVTQPALYTVCCALADVVKSEGISPTVVAGHSLGEYAALYTAGYFDFETGLDLVIERGKCMGKVNYLGEDYAPMAAVIGANLSDIEEVCQKIGDVYPSIINSPAQTVIAGKPAKVKQAAEELKEKGAKKVVPLKVSGPFHTVLMEVAAQEFAKTVENVNFKKPQIPIYTNVETHAWTDEGGIGELIVAQIYNPIKWVNVMYNMVEDGIKEYVEIGPGTVLKGLFRSTVKEAKVGSLRKLKDLETLLNSNEQEN